MTANTPRQRMNDKRRQHIFSENCTGHNVAPCCICSQPIHRHNDRWIVERKRALALLGKDVNNNCGPAHYDCARVKTHTEDLPKIRKPSAGRLCTRARKRSDGRLAENVLLAEGYAISWRPKVKRPWCG
ncbi:hypothetical protein [Aminobacter aminovorans]|uniref:HNH endonuclease n=1 Tax=Aminobacter aminovorans TaxID=83263 RepID=A0AAC9APW8_AMIAI|nr:hypothetical protein [Aminobacter aminovorans]AMS39344.1 hypothetical protein AA2016_0405 [Aminobacter aminovorans]MBB3709956.1 hypothetical protein [Aminobacter aminovorans]